MGTLRDGTVIALNDRDSGVPPDIGTHHSGDFEQDRDLPIRRSESQQFYSEPIEHHTQPRPFPTASRATAPIPDRVHSRPRPERAPCAKKNSNNRHFADT